MDDKHQAEAVTAEDAVPKARASGSTTATAFATGSTTTGAEPVLGPDPEVRVSPIWLMMLLVKQA